MIHVLFICYDNACRSPMAEFIMKNLVKEAGLEAQFHIESAAAGPEEAGNMIAEPVRALLAKHCISYSGKAPRRMQAEDYGTFDFLVAMDWTDFSRMEEICGGDPEGKFHLLLDFTGHPGEVSNPWPYSNYEKVWEEIKTGCQGLLEFFTAGDPNPGQSRRILCYGDSNTYGHDPRSLLGERYPDSVRWTALLRRKGWRVRNEGANGRAIPHFEREIKNACLLLIPQKADVAVIMLGTNDLLQHPSVTAEICAKRMEAFLKNLLAESPPFQLLLVAPPAMVPGAWVESEKILEESRRLPDCYGELARKLGIGFANAAEWGVSLTFDGVHFSKNGHRTFAAGIHKALCRLLDT